MSLCVSYIRDGMETAPTWILQRMVYSLPIRFQESCFNFSELQCLHQGNEELCVKALEKLWSGIQKCRLSTQELRKSCEIMSDLVTPLLKILQHLLISLREKANHNHPCTLTGLFPPWGPHTCCSFCPECSFPGSIMTCSFTPFKSPIKIWSSV